MYHPRITSILKSLTFWLCFLVSLFVVGRFINPFFPASWERFVYGIGGTMFALALTWFFVRREKKSFRDYELYWETGTLPRFLKGFLYGALIFALIIGLLVAAGGIRIHLSGNWDPLSVFWYLSIIPLALMEELAFRGYPFIKLNRDFSFLLTQLIIAIVFALYHIVTGWDIAVALLGPGIWALVFGLGAVWSKGIALPTGIHVALNLSQQVLGMKGGNGGTIWVLNEVPSAAMLPANTVGMICQVGVGVVAIIITIRYSRKMEMK